MLIDFMARYGHHTSKYSYFSPYSYICNVWKVPFKDNIVRLQYLSGKTGGCY